MSIRIAVIHHDDGRLEFLFGDPSGAEVKRPEQWLGQGGESTSLMVPIGNASHQVVLSATGCKEYVAGYRGVGALIMSVGPLDPTFESLAYMFLRAYLEDTFCWPVDLEHYRLVQGHRTLELERIG